jgi:DNA-directed RNA polymerase specialized sigma24 family protein
VFGEAPELDETARTLVEAMTGGQGIASAAELEALRGVLLTRLDTRGPAASITDREEAVDEALTEFVAAIRAGRVRPEGAPGGYLFVAARRRLLNRLMRSPEAIELPEDLADGDDAIARLIEADASKSVVEDALRRARLARRYAVVRVVAAWLDLAERNGSPPTSAEVAKVTGTSPAAVRKALSRFREYLSQASAGKR